MERVGSDHEAHLLEHYHPNYNPTPYPNANHNHFHNHRYHPDDLHLLQQQHQQQQQQRHRHLLQLNASIPPRLMFNTSFPPNHTTESYSYHHKYGVCGEDEKPECGSSEYAEEIPQITCKPLSSTLAATVVGQENRIENRKEKREKMYSSTAELLLDKLAKKVMAEQEVLHQRLMEKVEKQEQERAQREEAYQRQEETRARREHEIKAEEYSIATKRDAAMIAFLHRLTSQTSVDSPSVNPTHHYTTKDDTYDNPLNACNYNKDEEESGGERERERGGDHEREKERLERENAESHARRWPKVEVHGLIRIRSGMEPRFQEAGPKAHLWEEVSNALACMGFQRSAKRCKEKWENINKYFRKTKDSCRKRPDNAKTCPYFHQLELLYNRGILSSPILAPSTAKHSNKTNPTSFYLNNNNNNNNNNNKINSHNNRYARHEINSEGLVEDIFMQQNLLDDRREYPDIERVPEQLIRGQQQERRLHTLSSKQESASFMSLLHPPLQNQDFHM